MPKDCPLTKEECVENRCAWSIKTSFGRECAITLLGTAAYIRLQK